MKRKTPKIKDRKRTSRARNLDSIDGSRLARECSKLDPKAEKALAEEGMSEELKDWPEY